MANVTGKGGAGAAAAAAAAEARRKAAEEAARRAAEAARQAAAAAAQKAAASQKREPASQQTQGVGPRQRAQVTQADARNLERLGVSAPGNQGKAAGFKAADELSTGMGSAHRRRALGAIGSTGAPQVDPAVSRARDAAARDTVDAVISTRATPAQREEATRQVRASIDALGGVGDAGITRDALPAKAQEILERARIPTAASADVRAQVDTVLTDEATPAQRQAAYEKMQAYVDRVGGLGDAGITKEAVPAAAVRELAGTGTPTVSPEVTRAVDEQLSSTATPAQRQDAYRTVQAYVDSVGGVGDAGITAEALPARVTELLAEQNVPTRATDAAAAVRSQVQQGASPADVARTLERSTTGMTSAELGVLMEELEPTLTEVAGQVNGERGNRDQAQAFYGALSRVAERSDEAGVQAMARAVSASYPDGHLGELDNALTDSVTRGEGTKLAQAMATELGRLGKTEAAGDVTGAITRAVDDVRADYQEKVDAYAQAQQRLTQEMASIGPALTPEQRQEYERRFWELPENKKAKDEEAVAGDALSRTLETAGPALEAAAASGNGDAAKALLSSYEQLARSPTHADEAITFAGRVNQDRSLARGLAAEVDDNDLDKYFEEKVLPAAVPNAQSELLARGLEPEDALAEYKELFKELTTTAGALSRVPGAINSFFSDISAIRAGNYDPVQKALGSWDSKSPFGKALAVASVAQGLYGAVEGFQNNDIPQALKGMLSATSGGLQLASGLLGTYAKAGKIASQTAEGVARFAGKFAPGIGLACDLISLYDNVDALKDGASAGEIVSLVGTGISLVGDVAGFIPGVGTAVDAVLGVVGAGVSAVGGMLSGEKSEGQVMQEESQQLLEQMGFSPQDAELFSHAGVAGEIESLAAFGMKPEELQAVIRENLWVDHGGLMGSSTDLSWVQALGGTFGITGAQFLELTRNADMRSYDYFSMLGGVNQQHHELLREGRFQEYRQHIIDGLKQMNGPSELIAQLEAAQRASNAPLPEFVTAIGG